MLDTKVTVINGVYHIRLISNKIIVDEMSCKNKIDISWCCSEMLRWYDKCGGYLAYDSIPDAKFASASRERKWKKDNSSKVPQGIKYIGCKNY